MNPIRTRRGFTLIELLVVIGIIAVILSILFPAFAAIRRSARVSADLANLRLLQAAMLGYATDYNGYLADARIPDEEVISDMHDSFVTTLKPWYDNSFALRSPLDFSTHWSIEMGGQGIPTPTGLLRQSSYGLNDFLTREFSPTAQLAPPRLYDRLSKVIAPASTIHMVLMCETGIFASCDHVHVEEWGGLDEAPPIAATMVATSAAGGLANTGEALSDWSFLDGHVATLTFNRTYVNETLNRFNPEVSSTFDSQVRGAASGP